MTRSSPKGFQNVRERGGFDLIVKARHARMSRNTLTVYLALDDLTPSLPLSHISLTEWLT